MEFVEDVLTVEEYAITYENLVLSTYSIEHILDLHLYEQINDHGMLCILLRLFLKNMRKSMFIRLSQCSQLH